MSGIRSLSRRPTQPGYQTATSAGIRVDDTTGQIAFGQIAGGSEVAVLAAYKPNAAITAATHAPAQKDSGLILTYSAVAGITVTLPAATGSGARYKYVRTTKATSVGDVFKVGNATDFMRGNVVVASGDGAGGSTVFGTLNTDTVATESDTVTNNFTTSGISDAGDWIEFVDIASAVWLVSGLFTSSGTKVTPFSAAQ
jgi:hypothetical protein